MKKWKQMFLINLIGILFWYFMGAFLWLAFNIAVWENIASRICYAVCLALLLFVLNFNANTIIKQWSE